MTAACVFILVAVVGDPANWWRVVTITGLECSPIERQLYENHSLPDCFSVDLVVRQSGGRLNLTLEQTGAFSNLLSHLDVDPDSVFSGLNCFCV